jgi:hypothetical protein
MDGKEIAFRIPADAEIVLIERLRVDSQDRTRRVKVEWNSQVVTIFVVDLKSVVSRFDVAIGWKAVPTPGCNCPI